jgi:anaerobic dimethyl sulfoxide reductase subunit C
MHHSLVFFTVICQTAAGALISGHFLRITGHFGSDSGQWKKFLLTILSLFFISLCIAFLHLGNPVNSVNALNNLKSSWLSREVFFLVCTGATLIIYLFGTGSGWNQIAVKSSGFISAVFSLFLIYSMIRLYMIPAVKSWNNLYTPAGFILTALTGGLALIFLFMNNNNKSPATATAFSLLIFIVASIAHTLLFNSLSLKNLTTLVIVRLTLSLTALIIVVTKYLPAVSNKNIPLKVIVLILITASEIVNRYIFFLSFEKSGL